MEHYDSYGYLVKVDNDKQTISLTWGDEPTSKGTSGLYNGLFVNPEIDLHGDDFKDNPMYDAKLENTIVVKDILFGIRELAKKTSQEGHGGFIHLQETSGYTNKSDEVLYAISTANTLFGNKLLVLPDLYDDKLIYVSVVEDNESWVETLNRTIDFINSRKPKNNKVQSDYQYRLLPIS